MEARKRGLITWPLVLAILALAVLDSASGDSANGNGTAGPVPPSVFIRTPEDRTFVPGPSFEITGGLGGSVQDIDVAIDGVDLGPARRDTETDGWRFPAAQVSVTPGRHLIIVTATGEGGRATAAAWVYYDTENLPFAVEVDPESTVYQQGDTAIADDPDLLLFGPAEDPVTLDMSTSAPPEIRASVNDRLSTGSLASLDLDIRDDTPGEYPAIVRGVGPDGTAMEATHTVVIVGEEAPEVEPPTTGSLGVLRDDFEGDDLWTDATTTATNGASATAGIAGAGNPGGFREMIHTLPGTEDGENNPTRIVVEHLYTARSWDPATDGPLVRIVYSEDQIMLDPPFDGAAVGTLVLLKQGVASYTAPVNDDNAFSTTQWSRVTVELAASDFSPAPGPDFSEQGAPLTFGILRSNTSRSSTGIVVRHGIDNWTVELIGE